MALMDTIRQRRSVRKYLDKKIEREKIVRCIEAARLAPSAENVQPWRFIVLEGERFKTHFCQQVTSGIYSPTRFIQNAPGIIAIAARLDILANRIGKWIQGTSYYLLDIGIAGEHLVLQAQELGIGTCWIGWFNAKKARNLLNIPGKYRVVALIAMGYPAEGATKDRPDLSLEEILFFYDDEKRLGLK